VDVAVADELQQGLEIRILDSGDRRDHAEMVDDHRHLTRHLAQIGCGSGEHAVVAENLHHPAEIGHRLAERFEHVKAGAAHVFEFMRKQMKAQAAHA